MKSRKRYSNINGRGIRRGSEAAVVKQENFYFREFENGAIPLGIRRISCIAESKPKFRPNIFAPSSITRRLDAFFQIFAYDPLLSPGVTTEFQQKQLTEENFVNNAERIWAIKAKRQSSEEAMRRSNEENMVSFDVRMNNHVPRSSLPGSSSRDVSHKSVSISDRRTPVSHVRSSAERLKNILKAAMSAVDTRYVQTEHINFDDRSVESADEVSLLVSKSENVHSAVATESDSSQLSSTNSNTACRPAGLPFNKSATDPSAPDDIIDAVSTGELPSGALYHLESGNNDGGEGKDKDQGDNRAKEKDDEGEMAKVLTAKRITSGMEYALKELEEELDSSCKIVIDDLDPDCLDKTKKRHALNQAVTAHVEASRKESRHTISRYNFNRIGRDFSKLLSSAAHGGETNVDVWVNLDKSSTPRGCKSGSKSNLNVNMKQPVTNSRETSESSQTMKIQNAAETLELNSQCLIRDVLTVNSSNTIDVLNKLGALKGKSDGIKHSLGISYDLFNDGLFKAGNKFISKKKAPELQRDEMHDEFLDSLQEKRKIKYMKGMKLTLNKGETQTRLCFHNKESPKVPKIRSVSTEITSTPDKMQRSPIENDSSTMRPHFGNSSKLSNSECSNGWFAEGLLKRIDSGERTVTGKPFSMKMLQDDHCRRNGKKKVPSIWRRKKPKHHDSGSSKRSLSDTNSIHSCLARSAKNSKSSTYERSENMYDGSLSDWRSELCDDQNYVRGSKRPKHHERDLLLFRETHRFENPEPYRKVSQTENSIMQLAHDKLSSDLPDVSYRSGYHYRDLTTDAYYP